MAEFKATFSDDGSIDTEEAFNDVGNISVSGSEGVNITPVTRHNDLVGRSAENSHPVSAITGLEERLSAIEAGTVTDEERERWNSKSRVYRNASGALVIAI